jgi:ribosome recycling factor
MEVEMITDTLKSMDEKMKKAIEHTRSELVKIRTGKATTALLDGVKVEYYSQIVPLQQVANVAVQDIHTINVTPWDKTMLQPIEKAIQAANLGLNPIVSGTFLRIPIPPLNEERRKELVKLVKKFGEDGKIAIRNLRRDAIEHIKKSEKIDHVSEDDRKKAEKNAQETTDKMIKEIDNLLVKKEKEIMEV